MKELIGVLIGGALGAGVRYLLSEQSQRWFGNYFPYGTLIVNVSGCLILGGLFGWGMDHMSPTVQKLLITGFLGSLTTFSTFGLETYMPWEKGEWFLGIINIVSNLVLGLLAVWIGCNTVRWLR
jgi:CrcB protein